MSVNSTVRPVLADVYFDWSAQAADAPQVATSSILATTATDSWGPVNTPVFLTSYDGPAPSNPGDPAGYLGVFGADDTELRRAVYGAFKGQGVNGQGGAGGVYAYRLAGSGFASGHITLNNTAGTPVAALTLTAKYPGTRANRLKITVQASPTTGNDQLLVLDGALVIEKYDYLLTDIVALAAQINLLSGVFTATETATGTGLALVSAATVSGGNDGTTLVGADWTAAQAALDSVRFQYFAPYNLTDSATITSVVAWGATRNANGMRTMICLGGALNETLSTASTRSSGINDYQVINLGVGALFLTDDQRSCSTAEFVTRYMGARCFRGEAMGDIFVRFADVTLTAGASLTDQIAALGAGVGVFSKDTNADAPVYIREIRNTYVDDSQSPLDPGTGEKEHPQAEYCVIKNIAIQQGIEIEVGDWARTGNVLGAMNVDDKTRAQVLGRVQIAYSNRETADIVQPGWSVAQAAGASDDDDFMEYVHGFKPRRSLRQIFNTARMG